MSTRPPLPAPTLDVGVPAPEPAGAPLTAGEKARARQRALIAAGLHPLTRGPLWPGARVDVSPGTRPPLRGTCGTCCHRQMDPHHSRSWPKCFADAGARITRGAGSDVPAWWPACADYVEAPR